MTRRSSTLLPVLRARDSAYSYRCNACSRCCRRRGIQVNPYELARLAEHRSMSTTQLIEGFTREQGTLLAQRPDGTCVFLGDRGCDVHRDRPLVCRLYPLGRIARADGSEAFVEMEPHPQSDGVSGDSGTVAQYLESQGAGPFLEAARAYHLRFLRMAALATLAADGSEDPDRPDDEASTTAAVLLDVDHAVQEHCRATGEARPETVDGRVDLHLRLLDRWIDGHDRAGTTPVSA